MTSAIEDEARTILTLTDTAVTTEDATALAAEVAALAALAAEKATKGTRPPAVRHLDAAALTLRRAGVHTGLTYGLALASRYLTQALEALETTDA